MREFARGKSWRAPFMAAVLTAAVAGAALAPQSRAAGPDPVEDCVVTVGNQSARIQPDGSYRLANVSIPTTGQNRGRPQPVRLRATCAVAGATVQGQSSVFEVTPGSARLAESITFDAFIPVPKSIDVSVPLLEMDAGTTMQLLVGATYPGGSTADVTPRGSGTVYSVSSPRIATVDVDGMVSAGAPRRDEPVVLGVFHEGVLSSTRIVVKRAANSDLDGDGMPNDFEALYGFNVSGPGDAALDPDADGLSNLQEFIAGTNPLLADTDADGILDGVDPEPLVPESDPPVVVITSPAVGDPIAPGDIILASATVTDNVDVAEVQFFLNDALVFTDGSAPFETFVTVPLAATNLTLFVVGRDGGGNSAVAAVPLLGSQGEATVTLVAPDSQVVAGGVMYIRANVVDVVPTEEVRLFVNGAQVARRTQLPYDAYVSVTAPVGSVLPVLARAVNLFGQIAEASATTEVVADPGQTIVGTVFSSPLCPATNAVVTLLDLVATTDVNGDFIFTNVPSRALIVQATDIIDGVKLGGRSELFVPTLGMVNNVGIINLQSNAYFAGFEADEMALGSIAGQDGWIVGAGNDSHLLDQEVTSADARTGNRSWRISNTGVTGSPHGSFSMPYSPALAEGAGRPGDAGVVYDTMVVSFFFKSASPTVDGMYMDVDFSPTSDALASLGAGDRNSILRIGNDFASGMALTSFDQFAIPTTFAFGLSRTDWHRLDIVTRFGPSPNIGGASSGSADFQYFLNGEFRHADDGFATGFRDQNGFPNEASVRLLFHTRVGVPSGTAGIYFDDIFYTAP